jgi:hypothetical protein
MRPPTLSPKARMVMKANGPAFARGTSKTPGLATAVVSPSRRRRKGKVSERDGSNEARAQLAAAPRERVVEDDRIPRGRRRRGHARGVGEEARRVGGRRHEAHERAGEGRRGARGRHGEPAGRTERGGESDTRRRGAAQDAATPVDPGEGDGLRARVGRTAPARRLILIHWCCLPGNQTSGIGWQHGHVPGPIHRFMALRAGPDHRTGVPLYKECRGERGGIPTVTARRRHLPADDRTR